MAVSCDIKPRCKHCGLSLLSAADEFCCAGCRAVYGFIQSNNLSDFYRFRESEGAWTAKPAPSEHKRFDYMDDALFAERYVSSSNTGANQITFFVEGMHCSACVWLLEKAPKLLAGLIEVRVNIAKSCLYVYFDQKLVNVSQIAKLIESLGYTPHPLAPDAKQGERRQGEVDFMWRLGVAAFFASNIMLLAVARYQGLFSGMELRFDRFFVWVSFILCIPVATYSAWPFYRTAIGGLRHRRLHIDLPLAIAMLGAFIPSAINTIRGTGEVYFDSVSALVFFLLCGRLLQRRAIDRATHDSELLYSLTPLHARLVVNHGTRQVFVESLKNDDVVLVDRAEIFPVDGTVAEGHSLMNASILSGESRAVPIRAGDKVFAGTTNLGQAIKVRIEKLGYATRLGRLISMIEQASVKKSSTVQFTDMLSGYFVFGVLLLAILTFAVWYPSGAIEALNKVIALLVVSCPCALGIATPITFSLALAKAARRGIVIKNPSAIERAAVAREIIFDKTGTLTRGTMSVTTFIADRSQLSKVKSALLALEMKSTHPLASALVEYCGASTPLEIEAITELPGRGVQADSAEGVWRVGSFSWLRDQGAIFSDEHREALKRMSSQGETPVQLAINSTLLAVIGVSDQVRSGTKEVVSRLQHLGLNSHLLSGDLEAVAHIVAEQVGIKDEKVHPEMSPEDKATFVAEMSDKGVTIMVGDGVNDAVALKRAGVSIALKGGAEIALQVSDIFLIDGDLSKISTLISGSRKVMRLVRRTLALSLIYNICAALLAVCGLVGPLFAALLMPLSSISVILLVLFTDTFES